MVVPHVLLVLTRARGGACGDGKLRVITPGDGVVVHSGLEPMAVNPFGCIAGRICVGLICTSQSCNDIVSCGVPVNFALLDDREASIPVSHFHRWQSLPWTLVDHS